MHKQEGLANIRNIRPSHINCGHIIVVIASLYALMPRCENEITHRARTCDIL